ncbi:MAG: HDOD domain-containing protein [Planctomycetaceae bacterium]|nr:HDOD domain-containing protein [Planctomycetaceae bacterium]
MPIADREANVASTGDDSSVAQAMLRQCGQFATLPALAVQIIEIAEDPSSTWEDLRQVIAIDPAFGARLLKLVNSPFYGLLRPVGTLREALGLLGLRAVKNVAISTSLAKLFRGGKVSAAFNVSELWTHSIAVATAARMLSQSTKVSPDEAFLAGLVHDLGILVELQSRGALFVSMMERLDEEDELTFRCAESSTFQTTHEMLGRSLCELWRFPASLTFTAGFHHRPWELAEAEQALPALIHVADVMAARQNSGYSRTVETRDLKPEMLRLAAIRERDVAAVEVALPEAVHEACRILSN